MHKAIFPATFDPIHMGHVDIALRASSIFDEVIVGVYDHGRPTKHVLFSVEDRVRMTRETLGDKPGIRIESYSGLTVEFARAVGATTIVRGLRVFSDFELEFRMALANRRLAPDIDVVCLIASEQHMHLASSTIREIVSLGGDVSSMVPDNVLPVLLAKFSNLSDDAASAVDMVSLRD